MLASGRKLFPYVAVTLLIGSAVWAVSFGTLDPADFTFINATEIKSIDPAMVTGQPEHRVIDALFEGLLRLHPKTLQPRPAMAKDYELSEDQRTYTFHLRDDAVWSDHTPENPSSITAADFHWSWQRFLHPEIAAEYAYQLWYIVGAEKYSSGEVEAGDAVEVELYDRPDPDQVFPRGTMLYGTLKNIHQPPRPQPEANADEEAEKKASAAWRRTWIYTVGIDGKNRRFSKEPQEDGVERCHHVLLDFNQVGVKVVDDKTLAVTLKNPTPFFPTLMTFYPMHPVNRRCVERYGYPNWTRPENAVFNGPFTLKFRRIRDRLRMVKNPLYWNAEGVKLNIVDALAVSSDTTGLNMYLNGEADWHTMIPTTVIDELKQRPDVRANEFLATYFYRLNIAKKPLDDVRVRQALNMALDKQLICDKITKLGETPARSVVPRAMLDFTDYQRGLCGTYDPEAARRLLAEAGYPGGKQDGKPLKVEILYNTAERHRTIAEAIQSQWKDNLGIDVELKNQEWGVYLATINKTEHQVARAGWIADYPDPNTFLDMFVTGGELNRTNWSNARYDEIIKQLAPQELDGKRRLALLHEAEQILMDELPILPIYYYAAPNIVRPHVKGWYPNALDTHPLGSISIDADLKKKATRGKEAP